MAPPLFILAPPRSFTSIVCAMIGQHPQMYGLPETNLFMAATMREWWTIHRRGRAMGAQGLLRAVAQVCFGEQTEETIELARWWLRRRLHQDTGSVFRELAGEVHPQILVDKSPTTVYSPEYLQRLLDAFPRARFIHLLRHPRTHGESLLSMRGGRLWLAHSGAFDFSTYPPTVDPQVAWYTAHTNICDFLSLLPKGQKMRIRGENLLANPEMYLREIAEWLGVRADQEAIEQMKHPERSPFASFGPPSAPLGNDPHFLEHPALRPAPARGQITEALVGSWNDRTALHSRVKRLAKQFGYE